MRKAIFLSLTFLLSLLTFTNGWAQDDKTTAETVVHLLSYVSMDYPGAVENGQIIDKQEYAEQQEFSAQAYKLIQEGNFLSTEEKDQLSSKVKKLQQYIANKSPKEEISAIANTINAQIIKITGLVTAPKVWPTLANGKALYQQNCAMCHGANGGGDGPAGKNLDPVPSNFHERDLMENFSAYQAYNSIRLGVPGTAMQSYASTFNEVELWDLAFYIKSLRFEDSQKDSTQLQLAFAETMPKIGLNKVANYTDKALLDTLSTFYKHPETALAGLRTKEPTDEEALNSLPVARKSLKDALASYKEGNKKLAQTQAISAYLDGIEPVEARLRTQNSDFVAELEKSMFEVRQAINKDKGAETVSQRVDDAMAMISQADDLMHNQKLNYWLTFIIAASIFLREALEAFLIIAVVLALIKKADAKKALPWLHGGWITAVIAGIIGWFLSDYIINFGGKNREVLEGLISLFAVLVLMFVGFWLHNKTEAQAWTKFIKEKIGTYLSKDRMLGLAVFAFIVVFREAFELILFLQAVSLEAAAENQSAIGLGVLAGVIGIAIIAFAFFRFSKMFPVRKVFLWSSWIILLLAVILIGKGFHSLQESGWIGASQINGMFRSDWLGIYPTWQTLLAQLGLIVVVIVVFFINKKRHQKAALQQG